MPLFTVDPDLCSRDGVCIDECPVRIIRRKDAGSPPEPVNGAESVCISCGHCVAVCSSGALVHKMMDPKDCPPVKREFRLTPEHAEHFLRARRSIRTYNAEPADREILKRIIQIASHAPSGHNRQPVSWFVIYDRGEVRQFSNQVIDWMKYMLKENPGYADSKNMDMLVRIYESGDDIILRGAPHLIIAHAPEMELEPSAPPACVIAMAYLELAAVSFGLGTCWAGYFKEAAQSWEPIKTALDLPDGQIVYGAMMIGYPKYKYHRLPLRNEPRITWSL